MESVHLNVYKPIVAFHREHIPVGKQLVQSLDNLENILNMFHIFLLLRNLRILKNIKYM
jgi:hypothetical protein